MRREPRNRRWALLSAGLLLAGAQLGATRAEGDVSQTALIGLGDSLTHGTMDATNNYINTQNAYLQRVRNALARRIPVVFGQPLFDLNEDRIDPSSTPTNLGVDGADSFTLEGLDYYKRAGVPDSLPSTDLVCDKGLPSRFKDDYDKVLYPTNLLSGRRRITQIGAAEWLLQEGLPASGVDRTLTVYWVGNNDSSVSALGIGGSNPTFLPLPAQQLFPVMPGISLLLQIAEKRGLVSLDPYTAASIDRNLTGLQDFVDQQQRLIDRLVGAGATSGDNHLFVLTLPYYSAVGYLFDSEDLEFYLRKVNPRYRVPRSFARVAPAGQPITDPLKGDRISVLTFGLMYAMLDSGLPVWWVNQALELRGRQRDGLVLSEAEAQQIMTRIDGFNAALRSLARAAGPNVHVVEIGPLLSQVLTGRIPLTIGGHRITRKWIRGSAFGFDGVHPGYTGQALIADVLVRRMNAELGLNAPLESLAAVIATDPYVDRDGDGWAAGPSYEHDGITQLLFLLKDPDDSDPDAQVDLPADVWDQIREALLGELLQSVPQLRPEAERLGLTPAR